MGGDLSPSGIRGNSLGSVNLKLNSARIAATNRDFFIGPARDLSLS
jgi:hypothetical protein